MKKAWVAEKVGYRALRWGLLIAGKSVPTMAAGIRVARVLGVTVEELWGHLMQEG